ncbi:MAG: 3-oxoacyl-(acyl-carrier-protein) reductase [Daejeonella sp.]|nr:3-oxoacyl-(acyl-carrier-protein) reductase [Daejeonella sp.]
MFNLTGKVTLITGGGSGIGRAISAIFAAQGALVFILDIDDKSSLMTVDMIRQKGGIAHYKKCSIADQNEVNTVIDKIKAECGHIDIVVNNAGISHIGNAENTTAVDFERLLSVNVKGVYHVINAAVPYLKEKGGVILNMTSVASLVGLSDRFAYSMTKGAVLGMTLSVAKDYLPYNIRCNCISPARVHTPFVDGFISKNYPGKEEEMFKKLSATQPIGRMAKPEEIAYLALYLCSDEASFVTGSDYPIDGGFTRLNN